MINFCPACGSQAFNEILSLSGVPQYNLNYSKTREESLNMKLKSVNFVQCIDCSFAFNRLYSQLDYQVHYDANRSYSETFCAYLSDVAQKLRKNIPDDAKTIVEVGAGDCQFAHEILKLKEVEYHAFDPSWPVSQTVDNLHKYNTYYDKSCTIKPDVLVLRHVLEHMSGVYEFLKSILHEQPKQVLIEVPCFEFVGKNNNYHYFSHEHCSYFTKSSLIRVMKKLGYKEVFFEYIFGQEYILSLWSKDEILADEENQIENNSEVVNEENDETFHDWQIRLNQVITTGSIIWGASGKGVMLLNLLKFDFFKMPIIIDINPSLSGLFIPGTGNEIQTPKILQIIKPNRIFILNHMYQNEIEKTVSDLGLNIPIISLFK